MIFYGQLDQKISVLISDAFPKERLHSTNGMNFGKTLKGGVNTIVPKVKSTGAWRPIEKYKRIDCVGVDEHGPHQWLGIQLHTDLRAGRAYSLDV